MAWFLDNTSALVFLLLSSADSPGLRMSPRLIVTVVRHLHALGARIAHHPLSKLRARPEAQNCPPRGLGLYVVSRALSPKLKSTCQAWIKAGLKNSFRFINVQAITSILAAILTRIFVRMPFSRWRPSRSRLK
jgi:hypothetical protein